MQLADAYMLDKERTCMFEKENSNRINVSRNTGYQVTISIKLIDKIQLDTGVRETMPDKDSCRHFGLWLSISMLHHAQIQQIQRKQGIQDTLDAVANAS